MASGPSGMIDFYAVLEVEAGADAAAIKKSYRQLVLKYHPDKNPEDIEAAEEKIRKINNAYETLSNPVKRAAYDAQARATLTKAHGVPVDTRMIQPRMSIPKEFMLCPIGHPDRFMRTVGKGLSFQTRGDVSEVEFDDFFIAARFSLWWLPEVNNMCRLRTQPLIVNGIISPLDARRIAGGPPSGSILSFGLSAHNSSSDVMLTDSEQPACTNVIAVASPDYPGAFRFEAAYFPGHFLAFDPPRHAMMMRGGDQFAAIDFFLLDFYVAEQYKTLDEILIPAVVDLGGDRAPVQLNWVCQDHSIRNYFQTTMGGTNWDYGDFASYFHAHSDVWDYEPNEQVLRLRGVEDKLGRTLKRARTFLDAVSALLESTKGEARWLPLDSIECALRMLPESQSSAQAQLQEFGPHALKRAQTKLLSILKQMCTAGDKVSLNGLSFLWCALAGFGGDNLETDTKQLRREAQDAVVLRISELLSDPKSSFDFQVLDNLLDVPLNWEKCGEIMAQKGQQLIAKEPLDKLLPLMRKAAKSRAGKFGECLATSAMMKLFGAQPTLAIDVLDAMVSGSFGLEGAPMVLRMFLPRVPLESGALVVAELMERGAQGSDLDACREAVVANDAFTTLPESLCTRLRASGEAQKRSRSRSRQRRE